MKRFEIKKARDALEILRRRRQNDPELQRLYEEEKINLQVALSIREAREQAGLTQAELARRIGTKQSVISRLEDADYEGHSLSMYQKIAEALNRRVVISMEPAKQRHRKPTPKTAKSKRPKRAATASLRKSLKSR